MKERRSVFVFLAIALGLSAVVEFLWIRGGEAASQSGISALLMWCPAIAALVVKLVYYRKEKLLGLNGCKPGYLLAGVVVPLVICAVSYGIYWLVVPGSFTGKLDLAAPGSEDLAQNTGSPVVFGAIVLLVSFVMSMITSTGEEIGWRGFLLPQMAKVWNIKTAVIATGLIWAGWHMPVMLAGLYNPGTPWWFQMPMFLIQVMAVTVVISVLRMRSGSVWPAILLHASHNYFDQLIFRPLTSSPNQAWFVSETGILFVTAYILAAIVALRWFKSPNEVSAGLPAEPSPNLG